MFGPGLLGAGFGGGGAVVVQGLQIPTRERGSYLKLGGSTSKLEDLFYYEEGRLTEKEDLL